MGEDASSVSEPDDVRCGERWPNRALTVQERAAILHRLEALTADVVGSTPAELVELVEQIATELRTAIPVIDETHGDFVPTNLRVSFDDREWESRKALRALAKKARLASQLAEGSHEFALSEVDPFEAAMMRLWAMPADGTGVYEVLSAINLLAGLNEVLTDEEKPGPRPMYNLCRSAARAAYYYRTHHGLSVSVNFDYTDRIGVKPGARTAESELEPLSPMARLACEVVWAFGIEGDAAEVQTHLRNYQSQLATEGRKSLRSDFVLDF